MAREIVLRAVFPGMDKPKQETLQAEPIGPNVYRLLHSPGFVEGVAAGDEIALDEHAPHGYRVLKRGGNLCTWVVLTEASVDSAALIEPFKRQVEKLGGYLDGGSKRTLVFTVPLAAGWNPIESVFDNLVKAVPGSDWFFGNVYDPADGETPLGWWRDS